MAQLTAADTQDPFESELFQKLTGPNDVGDDPSIAHHYLKLWHEFKKAQVRRLIVKFINPLSLDDMMLRISMTSICVSENILQKSGIHGRKFESLEDERKRFLIFVDNYHKIQHHNLQYKLGLTTFTMGLNQFADKEPHEVCCGGLKHRDAEKKCCGKS